MNGNGLAGVGQSPTPFATSKGLKSGAWYPRQITAFDPKRRVSVGYASHPEEDCNAYLARVLIPSPTSDVIYSTDIFWRIIHGFALRKKSRIFHSNIVITTFYHTHIEASKNVIRIEFAARLIIQAYELGLEGKLQELDPRQRIAALVDLDLAKAPPKLKEIEEKEKKVFGLGRCARQP
jgi:hypothetical protein